MAPLNAAIYPEEGKRRVQQPAQGCPAFTSKDSVLDRPDGDPATGRTVCPGAHTVGDGEEEHAVVWWAPADLSLGAQTPFGLRHDDLIVKDVPPLVLKQYRAEYDSWRTKREAAIESAKRPSIGVMTATEAAGGIVRLKPDTTPVTIQSVSPAAERPHGARFGTLVHALLSDVPLAGATEETITRLAEAHGRIVGADDSEIAAARDVVHRALVHPVIRAAAHAEAAGACYRETPVTLRLEDDTIVEGHVDLAFDDGNGFVVVDFKTDRELEGVLERYVSQVQVYATAISRATGRPARAVLMQL